MEFNEKLQELRKLRGLTQDQLAESLYVSRTAISKWESGRGYPNIESLKMIAKFFAVTVDDLISTDEVLTMAAEENRKNESNLRDLIYGLLDLCMAMLFFLPFFAMQMPNGVRGASLIDLCCVSRYIKILYYCVVILAVLFGIAQLALQNVRSLMWAKIKSPISLAISTVAVLLFLVGMHPYAGVFAFALLGIKTFLLINRH